MKLFHPVPRSQGRLALAVTTLWSAAAFAQPLATAEPGSVPIVARLRGASTPSGIPPVEARGDLLGRRIAATAHAGLLESGREAAAAALIECQRGDYPGGGSGLLSMPFGRSASRTDHCFR